jgi:hypothetical protein
LKQQADNPLKRTRWARARYAVAAVLLAGAGFVYGYLSHRNGLFPASLIRRWSEAPAETISDAPPGRWRRAGAGFHDSAATQEAIDRLRSIGYLSGSDLAPDFTEVTVHEEDKAFEGVNLYTSGHAPEAILMGMDGAVMHTWSYAFDDVWSPAGRPTSRPGVFAVDYWRRAHLFDNGDLLAIYEGFGVIKLDRDSRLLWSYPRDDPGAFEAEPGPHHDLFVDEDGLIYVLTRRAEIVPRINRAWPILEDFVTILTPAGESVDSVSVLEAFERSQFAPVLANIAERGDIFHTNTIEVFDGRHAGEAPIFKRGNVLISLREIDVIAIIDMELRKVVWAITGMTARQHQPTLLDNGNMLVFDNLGNHGRSNVIEVDPLTQQVVWEYPGAGATGLLSETCGSAQRLPNGNTLITETDRGRALEVDASGNIVWEFFNPHRAGDEMELIASLFEVVRLPPGFGAGWLDRRGASDR